MKNRFFIVLILILTLLCGCYGKTNYVTMYVTNCETAEMRDKPTNDSSIIKILNEDEIVSYEKDVKNGYSKIVYDGVSGYVLSKYLTYEKPQGNQVNTTPVQPINPNPEPQHSNVNMLNNMTDDQRREVNIFLSNFSEAFYGSSHDNAAKIGFAFVHLLINESNSKVVYKGNYMGMSANDADAVLNRFFGYSVPHATPSNSDWIYDDGKFLMPAAAGESYGDFSIATYMTARSDGNYDVEFNVYYDSTVVGGDVITDKSIYRMTDIQVSSNPRFEYNYSGSAVLKPIVYNGKNTYQLVTYNIY